MICDYVFVLLLTTPVVNPNNPIIHNKCITFGVNTWKSGFKILNSSIPVDPFNLPENNLFFNSLIFISLPLTWKIHLVYKITNLNSTKRTEIGHKLGFIGFALLLNNLMYWYQIYWRNRFMQSLWVIHFISALKCDNSSNHQLFEIRIISHLVHTSAVFVLFLGTFLLGKS